MVMKATDLQIDDRYATGTHPIEPVLAYELAADDSQGRRRWILENASAIEYSAHPFDLDKVAGQVAPFLENGIPVRFHARYPGFEIANADRAQAEEALKRHLKTVDAIQGLGEPFITVHIGLNPLIELDPARAESNLCRLVDHARARGITVCLENLRCGLASEPENIMAWSEASGSRITFDAGHAISSQLVKDGAYTVNEIIDMFTPRLSEAHVYAEEKETGHCPITDTRSIGPVLDRLLGTGCGWWTVELKPCSEAYSTKKLLAQHILKHNLSTSLSASS